MPYFYSPLGILDLFKTLNEDTFQPNPANLVAACNDLEDLLYRLVHDKTMKALFFLFPLWPNRYQFVYSALRKIEMALNAQEPSLKQGQFSSQKSGFEKERTPYQVLKKELEEIFYLNACRQFKEFFDNQKKFDDLEVMRGCLRSTINLCLGSHDNQTQYVNNLIESAKPDDLSLYYHFNLNYEEIAKPIIQEFFGRSADFFQKDDWREEFHTVIFERMFNEEYSLKFDSIYFLSDPAPAGQSQIESDESYTIGYGQKRETENIQNLIEEKLNNANWEIKYIINLMNQYSDFLHVLDEKNICLDNAIADYKKNASLYPNLSHLNKQILELWIFFSGSAFSPSEQSPDFRPKDRAQFMKEFVNHVVTPIPIVQMEKNFFSKSMSHRSAQPSFWPSFFVYWSEEKRPYALMNIVLGKRTPMNQIFPNDSVQGAYWDRLFYSRYQVENPFVSRSEEQSLVHSEKQGKISVFEDWIKNSEIGPFILFWIENHSCLEWPQAYHGLFLEVCIKRETDPDVVADFIKLCLFHEAQRIKRFSPLTHAQDYSSSASYWAQNSKQISRIFHSSVSEISSWSLNHSPAQNAAEARQLTQIELFRQWLNMLKKSKNYKHVQQELQLFCEQMPIFSEEFLRRWYWIADLVYDGSGHLENEFLAFLSHESRKDKKNIFINDNEVMSFCVDQLISTELRDEDYAKYTEVLERFLPRSSSPFAFFNNSSRYLVLDRALVSSDKRLLKVLLKYSVQKIFCADSSARYRYFKYLLNNENRGYQLEPFLQDLLKTDISIDQPIFPNGNCLWTYFCENSAWELVMLYITGYRTDPRAYPINNPFLLIQTGLQSQNSNILAPLVLLNNTQALEGQDPLIYQAIFGNYLESLKILVNFGQAIEACSPVKRRCVLSGTGIFLNAMDEYLLKYFLKLFLEKKDKNLKLWDFLKETFGPNSACLYYLSARKIFNLLKNRAVASSESASSKSTLSRSEDSKKDTTDMFNLPRIENSVHSSKKNPQRVLVLSSDTRVYCAAESNPEDAPEGIQTYKVSWDRDQVENSEKFLDQKSHSGLMLDLSTENSPKENSSEGLKQATTNRPTLPRSQHSALVLIAARIFRSLGFVMGFQEYVQEQVAVRSSDEGSTEQNHVGKKSPSLSRKSGRVLVFSNQGNSSRSSEDSGNSQNSLCPSEGDRSLNSFQTQNPSGDQRTRVKRTSPRTIRLSRTFREHEQ